MVNFEDIRRMRRAESNIVEGRKVKPGDFYLEKSTLTAIDPNTGAKTYSVALEIAHPTTQTLKGDEREIVAGMEVAAGDIIVTFSYAKNIPTAEPSTVGGSYYDRVQYNEEGSPGTNDYYKILSVWAKGLGPRPNRKVLFAAKGK